MAETYRFYSTAVAAQDNIWRYTAQTRGAEQADRYIAELHEHMTEPAGERKPWRRVRHEGEDLYIDGPKVFVSRYASHMIFFRVLPDGALGVISILHERMDLPARLANDLRALPSDGENP